MKKNHLILLAGSILGTSILFQNCSKVNVQDLPNTDSLVSNVGIENCSSGTKLSVFLDDENQTYLGDIVAYSGTTTGAVNYHYYSNSAHPLVGPSPMGFEVQVFFFTGSDGMSLTFYANKDNGGSKSNQFNLDITTLGNNKQDKVLLVDDPNGGDHLLQSDLGLGYLYQGQFHYWSNTDGGVIGPFAGQDFQIHIKFDKTGDNRSARFFSAGGSNFALTDQENNISSFIIRYHQEQVCN